MGQYHNKELIQKIAQRLKGLRDAKGVSQKRVSLDTEIHIGRLESAKANPTISTISRLCEYYDLSLADFFEGLS